MVASIASLKVKHVGVTSYTSILSVIGKLYIHAQWATLPIQLMDSFAFLQTQNINVSHGHYSCPFVFSSVHLSILHLFFFWDFGTS